MICKTCNKLEGGFLGIEEICSVCASLSGVIANANTLEEAEKIVKIIFEHTSPEVFLLEVKQT